MSQKIIFTLIASLFTLNTVAADKVVDFQAVNLFAFECSGARGGAKGITGVEWNSQENILRIYQEDSVAAIEIAKEFGVTQQVPRSFTLTMFGESIDGSGENAQFILRDQSTPSTLILNNIGVAYVTCQIQTT